MSETDNSLDLQILTSILHSLVTVPEKVQIVRNLDEQGVLLTVQVDEKDMGIVIGRNGSMATAIKTLLRAVGKANQMNIRVHFLEPDGSRRYNPEGSEDFKSGGNFKPRNNDRSNHHDSNRNYSTNPASSDSAAPSVNVDSLDDDLKEFVIN